MVPFYLPLFSKSFLQAILFKSDSFSFFLSYPSIRDSLYSYKIGDGTPCMYLFLIGIAKKESA